MELLSSVTRVGDLLDFGQLFEAFGNNYFAQNSHILRQFLKRCQNLSYFSWIHFWATFMDIWQFFLVTLLLSELIWRVEYRLTKLCVDQKKIAHWPKVFWAIFWSCKNYLFWILPILKDEIALNCTIAKKKFSNDQTKISQKKQISYQFLRLFCFYLRKLFFC